jgi:hypothetical protein
MPFKGEFPKCFESKKQYSGWLEEARTAPPRYGFCTDCTKSYKEEMLSQGRCSYPSIVFRADPTTGEVEGHLPYDELKKLRGSYGVEQEREEDLELLAGEEDPKSY